jgi:hypothetical protein
MVMAPPPPGSAPTPWAGLIGIGPKDEIEGMIAAQLLAARNAAMECYRRAMIREQTGHSENLSQANRLYLSAPEIPR